ncbi:hypothetical protein Tco_0888481 [Tanacetum coccineum]
MALSWLPAPQPQAHVASTATSQQVQFVAQPVPIYIPFSQPMSQLNEPHVQFASPHSSPFYVPGNHAYMANSFQSQATMFPQAFQTMTPQDFLEHGHRSIFSLGGQYGYTHLLNSSIYPSCWQWSMVIQYDNLVTQDPYQAFSAIVLYDGDGYFR